MPQLAILEWEDNVYVPWPEGVGHSITSDERASDVWVFLRNVNIQQETQCYSFMLFSLKKVRIQEITAAKVCLINPFKVLNNCIVDNPEIISSGISRIQCQHQNKVVELSGSHVCGVVNRHVFGVFIGFSQWLLIDDRKYFPKDGVDSLVF